MRIIEATEMTVTVNAQSAGTQSTAPDSRSAEKWIKQWQERREKSINDIRQSLQRDFTPERVDAAYNIYKPRFQDPGKTAEGGRWAVVDPEGLLLSTHMERADAEKAASAKRYARIIDLGANEEYRKKYLVPRSEELRTIDELKRGLRLPSKEYLRRTGAAGGGAGPDTGMG